VVSAGVPVPPLMATMAALVAVSTFGSSAGTLTVDGPLPSAPLCRAVRLT
jgi:hypothetical protein